MYSKTSTFYHNYLAMKSTADVTGGIPIAGSQSISDMSAVNLVVFYDIHGRKGEVLYFCPVPDTIQDFFFLVIDVSGTVSL
jgi:hypothetical protein